MPQQRIIQIKESNNKIIRKNEIEYNQKITQLSFPIKASSKYYLME